MKYDSFVDYVEIGEHSVIVDVALGLLAIMNIASFFMLLAIWISFDADWQTIRFLVADVALSFIPYIMYRRANG